MKIMLFDKNTKFFFNFILKFFSTTELFKKKNLIVVLCATKLNAQLIKNFNVVHIYHFEYITLFAPLKIKYCQMFRNFST